MNKRPSLFAQILPLPSGGPVVLGCGADLKNAFCLAVGDRAHVSRPMENLDDPRHLAQYAAAVQAACAELGATPEIVAHDLHPDYVSTRYARKTWQSARLVAVQHHHAHIAAAMAENRLAGPVIGVAYDGMGFGDDGTLWGGEILVCEFRKYRRAWHFQTYPLPGGDEATLNPERTALSMLLQEADGDETLVAAALPGLDPPLRAKLRRLLERGVRCPLSSSAGRLFDAAAALSGCFRGRIVHEGQAAIALQQAADPQVEATYDFTLADGVIGFGPMLRQLAADARSGRPPGFMAAAFHRTVAAATIAACEQIRAADGLDAVVLAGGVFNNSLLKSLINKGLQDKKFKAFGHSLLPCGDGAIGLGQAVVARAQTG